MYRINGIRLPLGYVEEDLNKAVLKKLNTYKNNLEKIVVLSRSIDARYKNNVLYVLNVAVELKNGKGIRAEEYSLPPRAIKDLGLTPIKTDKKIVIVGSGPAGLFAGLTLSQLGFKPIIIERGGSVEERVEKIEGLRNLGVLDVETNVQFGEGGAGTFSDGKLNTGISKEYTSVVFGELINAGAPSDIAYESAPHIGTDVLRKVVKNVRASLKEKGVDLVTHAKLTDVIVKENRITEIVINGTQTEKIDYLILAIGQSAEDTITLLNRRGMLMTPKPFSIGVRVEHSQRFIDYAQYGESYRLLPPADYKLSTHVSNGRGVYTFCMCPGGEVVCSSCEEGTVITNGMSNRARDSEYANSAVLVSVNPQDFDGTLFGGFSARKAIERQAYVMGGGGYKAPAQYYGDFIRSRTTNGEIKSSYLPGLMGTKLNVLLPNYVTESIKEGMATFGRKIKGFDQEKALFIAPETHSSCPIRMERNDKGESNIEGIYPCGEGAGYAGGITSSAVDGIKQALNIYYKEKSKI
ncbi:MAG: hypothetical protein IKB56_02875 [Clostridia bacterium]|nr:hypothetical protein [Clostridia bacterium]